METSQYILKEFEAFSLETKVSEVKAFFKETTYTHFPIAEKKELIGLISEADVQGLEENDKELGYFQ